MSDAKGVLEFPDLFLILCGIIMGTFARIITLKADTRQNLSYGNNPQTLENSSKHDHHFSWTGSPECGQ